MRRFTLLLGLALSLGATADNTQPLSAVCMGTDGSELSATQVWTGSRITFGEAGVTIGDPAVAESTTPWQGLGSIRFVSNTVKVDEVAASALRLRHNPVGDLLEVLGHDDGVQPLAVTSVGGAVCRNVPQWSGESVDVSGLAPGVYVLTIGETTLKFIKK